MSRKKPTKAQQARLDAIHKLPCMACVQEGVAQPWPTEAHHIVDRGYRKHSGGHDATIPLCAWHHRGLQRDGWTQADMTADYGPSLALQKSRFELRYESQRELLSMVDFVLGLQGIAT